MTDAAAAAAAARVTVVSVLFHSRPLLPTLAARLAALPHVTLVDNGSGDGAQQDAAELLPRARWIGLPHNLGFGAANNRAIQSATTEFVLLLNPDCELDPQAIATLVTTADRFPDAAVVAPRLLGRRGEVESTHRWRRDRWASRGPLADGLCCVGFASGACLLIRRAALAAVGGFDESYFLYYEDDDLCLRLASQGALLYEPAALATHRSRGSVGGRGRLKGEYLRGFHHVRSKMMFGERHLGERWPSWRRVAVAGGAVLEAGLRLVLLDRPRAVRALGKASGAVSARQGGATQSR